MFLQANSENGYLWSEQKKINFFSLIFLCSTLSARGCGGPFLNIQVLTIDLLKTILFYKKGFFDSFLVHIIAWHTDFFKEIGPFHVCPLSISLENNNNKLYFLFRNWNTRATIWIFYNTCIKRTIHFKKRGWGSKPALTATVPKWTASHCCQPLLGILPRKTTEVISNVFR